MQGIDINNSSLQQHAVNMTFPLKSGLGDTVNGLELWVPDGHLYIIDNLIITNQSASSVTTTVYNWQFGGYSNNVAYGMANTHFLHDDETTPDRGAENVAVWKKAIAATTSERPFGDSPYYLMAGQALNIYVTTDEAVYASYSFRDCF